MSPPNYGISYGLHCAMSQCRSNGLKNISDNSSKLSPDMNSFKHLWDITEISFCAQNPALATLSQLLYKQYPSIFLQVASNDLLNPCHVEMLNLDGKRRPDTIL
ncbi:hypothetical protein TNCV_3783271 [Trichonephila clavipes]|nr:hypothetical protein TNCV_3783271 [Trichonephila clavipes]